MFSVFFFFFLSSGGWGQIKLELNTLSRIFIARFAFILAPFQPESLFRGHILLETSIGGLWASRNPALAGVFFQVPVVMTA